MNVARKITINGEYTGIMTANGRGSMFEYLDEFTEYGLRLLENRANPTAIDIGCAYGYVAKEILSSEKNKDIKVIANDICQEHLDVLREDLVDQPDKLARLELKLGSVVEMEMKKESLDAIFALRVLHFMSGAEIQVVFQKFYSWLKPGGCIIVTCGSPFNWSLKTCYPDHFKELVKQGNEWPGFIVGEDMKKYSHIELMISQHLQHSTGYHVFTPEILIREAKSAGFDIMRSGYVSRIKSFDEAPTYNLKNDFACLVAVKSLFE